MTERRRKGRAAAGHEALAERVAALDDLQQVLERYEEAMALAEANRAADTEEAPGWPEEAQIALEAIEAYLRAGRQETLALEPISRDSQTGFFLDESERCWISFEDLLCAITVIFGMTGSGKSNTVAFILEKLLKRGVALSIIDPHGEYGSLRALGVPLLVVGITGGKADDSDLVVEPEHIGAVAEFSIRQGVSVIIDLAGLKKKLRYEVLAEYFEAVWTTLPDMKARKPYHLVLEEAHAYIPEGSASPVSDVVADLVTEYRKFGLGALIIDQRPARVKKTPITQARLRILHQVEDPLDIGRYKETIPRRARQMESLLDTFLPGTALIKNRRQIDVVQVKQRETIHMGATPTIDGIMPQIEIVRDELLVEHLREVLASVPPRTRPEGMSQAAAQRLQDAQEQLEEANRRIERLEGENFGLREQLARLASLLQNSGLSDPGLLQFLPAEIASGVGSTSLPTTLEIAEAHIAHVQITRQDSEQVPETLVDLQRLWLETREQLAQRTQELTGALALVETLQLQVKRLAKEVLAELPGEETEDSAQKKMFVPINEAKVHALQIWFEKKTTVVHRRMLKVLHENEKSMTAYEIASWIGHAESAIKNAPPTEMLKREIMSRQMQRGGYGYRSQLLSFLAKEFPGADQQALLERVLAWF